MKNIIFGAVFLILAPASVMTQELSLTTFFENVVGLQNSIAEMGGDTTSEVFAWRILSLQDSTLLFEKGGNLFIKGALWYRVSLLTDCVVIMWSDGIGRIWFPAGNATLVKKSFGWQLVAQDKMEVSSQYLQNILKKIKIE